MRSIAHRDRVLVAVWPGIDLYAGLAALWRLGARFLDHAPGVGLTVVYGSTEAVGAPGPEVSVRIVNGEILVAGNHVNPGYLDPARDRETKPDTRALLKTLPR